MSVATTAVFLDGALGERFGHRFDLNVRTPREALTFLCATLKGFRNYLAEHSTPGYHVFVGETNIGEEELEFPSGRQAIRIMPSVEGAGGDGGALKTILGVVLVVVGYVLSPYTGGASMALAKLGGAIAISGVAEMLAPSPKMPTTKIEKGADEAGHSFNGVQNVIAQGRCVPVAYGRVRIGSLVVSSGTSADTHFPGGPGGGPFGSPAGSSWSRMSAAGGISAWHNGGDGDVTPWLWGVDLRS
jgi:predicted phage tail protein